MASIIKRGNYWRVMIRRKGYEPQYSTFDTKQEALTWSREIESKMDRGVFVDRREAETTLLREAIERYKQEVTPSKKGAKQEVDRFKIILLDPVCNLSMAAIQGKHIAGYRDRRLAGVSPSTVVRDLNLLGHVFTVAMKDWGMPLSANPVQMARHPRIPADAARTRRLEGDEEERLLAACMEYKGQWLQAIVALAVETAMRRGELFGVQWKDVHIKHKQLHIDKTKNGEARDVPLSTRAIRILDGLPRSLDGRVFKFSTPDQITTQFHRACLTAGIENLRFHDLRHEATSRIAERVQDVHTLARITGHKTLQMLIRYYHPRTEDLAAMLG